MITSNNSPYRVVLADSAGKTANNHPIKVFLEGGSDFATKEDIEELNTKIEALSTDLSYKGSVEDYAHLPSDAQTGDVYTTADTGVLYVWDGDEWVALNESGVNVIIGEGAPTTATEGELGQNYLDTTSGSVYVLTSIEEESGGEKVYNWEKIVKEKEACPIKISTADYDTTVEGDSAVALYNLAPGLYITTENMLLTSGVSGLGTFDVPSGVLVSISAWDATHRLVQFDKNVFLTGVGVVGFTALPRTNSEMMFLTGNDVVDNIGGTIGVHRPISNRAVNDWKTQVEDMIDRHGSDPVSGEEVLPSSHRILGQIWINGNTGKIYVLAKIEPGVEDPTKVIYTWEELASAGASVFTTNEWNALWA